MNRGTINQIESLDAPPTKPSAFSTNFKVNLPDDALLEVFSATLSTVLANTKLDASIKVATAQGRAIVEAIAESLGGSIEWQGTN